CGREFSKENRTSWFILKPLPQRRRERREKKMGIQENRKQTGTWLLVLSVCSTVFLRVLCVCAVNAYSPVNRTNASSFSVALPSSMEAWAIPMPSLKSCATPAATKAAPALTTTTSRLGPFSPDKI